MGCCRSYFLFHPLQYSSILWSLLGRNGRGVTATSNDELTSARLLHQYLHHLDVFGFYVCLAFWRTLCFKLVDLLRRQVCCQGLKLSLTNTKWNCACRRSNKNLSTMSAHEKKEVRLAVMLMIVVLVFLICNVLPLIVNILEVFGQEINEVTETSNLLVTLNSSVNFFIYVLFGEKFKRQLLLCLAGLGCQRWVNLSLSLGFYFHILLEFCIRNSGGPLLSGNGQAVNMATYDHRPGEDRSTRTNAVVEETEPFLNPPSVAAVKPLTS